MLQANQCDRSGKMSGITYNCHHGVPYPAWTFHSVYVPTARPEILSVSFSDDFLTTFGRCPILTNLPSRAFKTSATSSTRPELDSRSHVSNLRRLKRIISRLPRDHPLRAVLMVEADEMSQEEFLAKVPSWLKLLALES